MQYRPEIDGLRALAVVPVVLFHAGFLAGGFVGVDVFFVISGFLITSVILADMQAERFTLFGFYERRARRILPALVVVILACLPPAWFWLSPRDFKDFGQSIIAALGSVSNVLFWMESGYFESRAELKPLLHTWSIGVEGQFYLVFPLVLLGLVRLGMRWTGYGLAALCVASLALSVWLTSAAPQAAFYLAPSRGWELFAGALGALARPSRMVLHARGWLCDVASAAGLALVIASIVMFDKQTPFPGIYALLPVAGALSIVVFADRGTCVGRLLANTWLVRVGLISYSVYLWHQPLFAFARYRSLTEPHPLVLWVLIALSFALAWVTWAWVERPFRRRSIVATPTFVTAAGVVCVAVGAVGYYGHATDGAPNREWGNNAAIVSTGLPSRIRGQCHVLKGRRAYPDVDCQYHVTGGSWAVLGDSHGVEISAVLADALKATGDGVHQFTSSACGPGVFAGSTVAGCGWWYRDALDAILASREIKSVVVTFRLNAYLFSFNAEPVSGASAALMRQARAAALEGLQRTLTVLTDAGKNVFLMLQVPELPIDGPRMVAASQQLTGVGFEAEGVSMGTWSRRSAYVVRQLPTLPRSVVVVDPAAVLCDKTACFAVKDGQLLYFDNHHVSLAGARLVVAELLRRAKAEGSGGVSR